MPEKTSPIDRTRAEVSEAELARCQAMSDDDFATIDGLLAEEVWYTHSNGLVEDKTAFMKSLRRRRRTVTRESLDVRLYYEVAVVIGGYQIVSESRTGSAPARHRDANALQVWARRNGQWQLVAHQGTPKAIVADP